MGIPSPESLVLPKESHPGEFTGSITPQPRLQSPHIPVRPLLLVGKQSHGESPRWLYAVRISPSCDFPYQGRASHFSFSSSGSTFQDRHSGRRAPTHPDSFSPTMPPCPTHMHTHASSYPTHSSWRPGLMLDSESIFIDPSRVFIHTP